MRKEFNPAHGILVLLHVIFSLCMGIPAFADNPLVTHIYTADPTARVFEGKLYIYPSHDIPEYDGKTGINNFFMEDYHVFSTTDLMNYTDHGVILHQEDVDWVDNDSNAMWAPDCIEKNGKYYFYFPGNFKVGVAIADHPAGPFVPVQSPIKDANGIDPCPFIDDDGTPYLYFGGGENLKVMRLQDDMFTPDMNPITVKKLPAKYKEGAFVFKRNGIYYFTFPHSPDGSEEIAYATGDSPLGPFNYQGVIMDRWTDGCWTNHHSIVAYQEQWYLFYHHHDLTKDQTLRSMCADKLFFNDDGSIRKVTPTRRGVGIRKAYEKIQVDRYADASGCKDERFQRDEPNGLYVTGITRTGWLEYPDVDFETLKYRSVTARVSCATDGGTIELRANSRSGDLLGTVEVVNTGGEQSWQTITGAVESPASGLQNLFLVFTSNGASTNLYNVNWARFNPEKTAQFNFLGDGQGSVVVDGTQSIHSDETSVLLDVVAPAVFDFLANPAEGSLFDGWALNGESVEQVGTVKEGDVVTATFVNKIQGIDAFSRIEAEFFDEQQGVQSEPCQEGGQNIGYIENGDFIKFNGVNFGSGAVSVSVRVASQTSGGTIKVCLDEKSAEPIATLEVSSTGGWQNWKTVTSDVTGATGKHDLYIKFSGGGGYLLNLNWIQFELDASGINSGRENQIPDFRLGQNYPNPFNPTTTICYSLPVRSKVLLSVFDTLGRKIVDLESGTREAGEHRIPFNGSDLESGMYVYRLETPVFNRFGKMIVIK